MDIYINIISISTYLLAWAGKKLGTQIEIKMKHNSLRVKCSFPFPCIEIFALQQKHALGLGRQ